MKALESSPIENLEAQPEGSRYFVVQVFDPESGLYVRGSIAITTEMQEELRTRCIDLRVPFEEGLPQAAAAEIMCQLWGTVWPAGHAITGLEEVTKEDLLARVRSRNERHEATAD